MTYSVQLRKSSVPLHIPLHPLETRDSIPRILGHHDLSDHVSRQQPTRSLRRFRVREKVNRPSPMPHLETYLVQADGRTPHTECLCLRDLCDPCVEETMD